MCVFGDVSDANMGVGNAGEKGMFYIDLSVNHDVLCVWNIKCD